MRFGNSSVCQNCASADIKWKVELNDAGRGNPTWHVCNDCYTKWRDDGRIGSADLDEG